LYVRHNHGIRKLPLDFDPMLLPLRDHVMTLEFRLQDLRDLLTRPALSAEERAEIETRMRRSELALEYYRKAYELERDSD